MDRRTVRIYERDASEWVARRHPRAIRDGRLDAFARELAPGARVVDLGCGPAWYAQGMHERGLEPIALDVARAMLEQARTVAPDVPSVCADLARLPFRNAALDGAWASACYMHLPRGVLPAALARAHAVLRVGAPFWLTLPDLGTYEAGPTERRQGDAERRHTREPFSGRLFAAYSPERTRDLMEGAGFDGVELDQTDDFWIWIRARRARTLPDLVRPGLRLLVCGLNPSLYAADCGIPFARGGNRFWKAALAARVVPRDRNVWAALEAGVGFTDCVKRATPRSSELERSEYAAGVRRVERLVRRYRPAVVCFVGLEGFRAAIDAKAEAGWVERGFAGRPAYLMPSTSGLNAHATLDDLTRHLGRAASGPG